MRLLLAQTSLGFLTLAASCAEPSDLLVSPVMVPCEMQDEAAPPATLRLVTYNIRSAQSSSLDDIAEVLDTLDADVIALQEVDHFTDRSEGLDQAEALAERLGMHSAFAASRSEGVGDYGVALLSRHPFSEVERLPLEEGEAPFEPRVALRGELCVEGLPLTVISVHADVYPWAAAQQVQGLAHNLKNRTAAAGRGPPILVAGDLNAEAHEAGPRALSALGLIDLGATAEEASTFGARRIDYVFASLELAEQVIEVDVPEINASDHRPVVVKLRWKGSPMDT
ncbi:MAG: endonuclease/exonuclease/phosphatase family protein [Myxococcota bacterium]